MQLYRDHRGGSAVMVVETDQFIPENVVNELKKKEDILEAFQPFYQETSLEQEVNVDLIYQTEKELLDYAIYNESDIKAFIDIWNHPDKQDATAMGKMTSVLKPVADRYNLKNPEERYQFRRQVRKCMG